MSYASLTSALRTHFETSWSQQSPVSPVPYTWADGPDYEPPDSSPWMRVSVLLGKEEQVAMGKFRRFRMVGMVDVQIHVPAGQGDGLAAELADRLNLFLRGRTLSNGTVLRAPEFVRVRTKDAWTQWAYSVPFQHDELVLNPN